MKAFSRVETLATAAAFDRALRRKDQLVLVEFVSVRRATRGTTRGTTTTTRDAPRGRDARATTRGREDARTRGLTKTGGLDSTRAFDEQNYSPSSKSMAPYMQTLARTAEFKRIRFVRVDIEAVPAVAEKCNVKALPTYQLYKNGEKLEEMSGALPSKLVAMLKEHNVKDAAGGLKKALGLIFAIVGGIVGVIKLKHEVEAREARVIEEEAARVLAEETRKQKAIEERRRRVAQAERGLPATPAPEEEDDEEEWEDDDDEWEDDE